MSKELKQKELLKESLVEATPVDLKKVLEKSDFSLTSKSEKRRIPAAKSFNEDELQDEENKTKLLSEPRIRARSTTVPVTDADLYLHRLQEWRALLGGATEDVAKFKKDLKDRKAKIDEQFAENMKNAFKTQRPLEQTYAEMDAFYNLAKLDPSDNNLPVMVVNCSADELRKGGPLWEDFYNNQPFHTTLNYKSLIGLYVMPGWMRTKAAIERAGKMGFDTRSCVVSDFADCKSIEEVDELLEEGGDFEGIKGTERWKEHMVLVGNNLRVRDKNRYEEEGLYISSSMVFAAKVFRTDDAVSPAVPVAGDAHAVTMDTYDGSQLATRLDLTDRKKVATYRDAVVPVAWRGPKKAVFWGCESLSADENFKQYNIRRVNQYIEKALSEFLTGQTWQLDNASRRKQLEDEINRFLRENSGPDDTRMLAGGVVKKLALAKNKDGSIRQDALDIQLEVKYKFAIKQFRLDLEAAKAGEGWDISEMSPGE